MNANPLIEATSKIPLRLNYFGLMAPSFSSEKLNGKDTMIVRVDMIKKDMAYGAALKTKLRLLSKVSTANTNMSRILNIFSDMNKLPEISLIVPKI